MANIFLAVLLLVLLFSITSIAYAQETGLRDTTSKGTLDVLVEPTLSEPEADGTTKASFKVSFLNPGTDTPHEHQDYDFRILKGGQVVFSAARQTGQSLIHNVPGTLTVPYTFQQGGDYVIQVYLGGTGIAPTIPTEETAEFPIKVTPEFPLGAIGIVATVMTGTIVLARRFKR